MTTLTLPATCGRAAAVALLPELAAMSGGAPLVIDGSAVTHVGQAMLQVLPGSSCPMARRCWSIRAWHRGRAHIAPEARGMVRFRQLNL